MIIEYDEWGAAILPKSALVLAPVPKPFKPMAIVPRNPRCAELYGDTTIKPMSSNVRGVYVSN